MLRSKQKREAEVREEQVAGLTKQVEELGRRVAEEEEYRREMERGLSGGTGEIG